MCGIAGIWNFDGREVSEESIIRFTDSLSHRGPDGRGIWHNEQRNLAMGHRRLAIIDLSREADQPMHYADNRYHIVFNGEIYNFIEVRKELSGKGYHFKTDSDTEVILAAYHEWREQMLPKFNGMWALAIFDSQRQECFIARDRFGIKPFLYHLSSTRFAFASEQKSFLQLENFNPRIDNNVATHFLKTGFGVEGGKHSMLQGVNRLQAGHWGLLKTDGNLGIRRWWNTLDHLVSAHPDLQKQAETFRELFYDSIKLRMRSDVPVGSCLSGGFDSSAVVSALAESGKKHTDTRMSKDWQQTFVATFPGKSNDERPQAEEVCNFTGVKGHFFEVKEEEALSMMDKVLFDFDDVYVGIPVAPWLIYRELRRNNVVVSLDGHGADELMGGYMHADGAYISNAPSLLSNWTQNQTLLDEYFSTLLPQQQPESLVQRRRKTLELLLKYHPDFYGLRKLFAFAKERKDRHIKPYSASFLNPGTDFESPLVTPTAEVLPEDWDETNRLLYPMFHHDILPTILRNFDRMSTAHGIEVRMPFMDWRLVSYAFSLPGSSKIKGGFSKLIAREAMRGHMPESIRASKVKIGFNAPMPEWFSGPLYPWMMDLLERNAHSELVNVPKLKQEIERNYRWKTWNWSNTGNVWKYLHYLWFENNFKNPISG